jgi:hypothetical protein
LVYSKMFFGFVMMSYLVILMVFFFWSVLGWKLEERNEWREWKVDMVLR